MGCAEPAWWGRGTGASPRWVMGAVVLFLADEQFHFVTSDRGGVPRVGGRDLPLPSPAAPVLGGMGLSKAGGAQKVPRGAQGQVQLCH